jgi:hypothetical protein
MKTRPKPFLITNAPTLLDLQNFINVYFSETRPDFKFQIEEKTFKIKNDYISAEELERINQKFQVFPFKDRFQFRKD